MARRLSRDKEYAAFEKKLKDAKVRYKSRPEIITGIYLEMAEYLRNSLYLVDEAESAYEKVISWGRNNDQCALDSSLAFRNLAEIAIEKGNIDTAISKITFSLEFAYKTGNAGLIQQALHQRAHICMSCGLPEKALTYAEECRKYLEENEEEIDRLRRDGDSKCRMAHLQNFMAAIYSELHSSDSFNQYNYDKKALIVNEKALNYARDHENWTLWYRSLLLKLELSTNKERVEIAELMCHVSSKISPITADERRFKREAKCHLALEKLRFSEQNDFSESKALLWKRNEEIRKEPESVSEDIAESVRSALVFIYKTEKRLQKANEMNTKNNDLRRRAQMCVFEKIGDHASNLGMNEIALTFYQRMLKCADRADDKRKAWCSMAESAKDCRLWNRALDFYKEMGKIEKTLGYSENEMVETEIAITIVAAEVDTISIKERFDKFREIYRKCQTEEQRAKILPDYVKFLKTFPSLCNRTELEEKESEKNLLMEKEGNKEQCSTEEPTENDEFDNLNEDQVLFNIGKEMKIVERAEKIVKERSNKNKHGESNLHEVARSGEYQQLKELIAKGYDVNQLDHGGWTPLSEAVSAQNFANVRLLLTKGANPNTHSKEFLVDEEQNKITSSGLTPLMEACSVGNMEIAKILLQFKARASDRDDEDWTALEYLREFLLHAKNLDISREEQIQKCIDLLQHRQAEEGFTARSYDDFLELLKQKKISIKRIAQQQRKAESGGERKKRRLEDSPECIELDEAEEDDESNLRKKGGSERAWIDDEDEENQRCSDEEIGVDEESRNLNDYRRCMAGLMRRKNGSSADREPNCSRTTLLLNRKKLSKTNGPSAKRLLFK